MNKNKNQKTVSVPKDIFGGMIKACKKFEKFSDKLEDFIISNDKEIIDKLKKARREHEKGKIKELDLN